MSQIPMRAHGMILEGEEKPIPWIFRANHRAWHTLEVTSGKGLIEWLNDLSGTKLLGPWHELAWALSSTHRESMGSPPTFNEFLDMLPSTSDGWAKFALMLSALVREAFPSPEKKVQTPVKGTSPRKKRARPAA